MSRQASNMAQNTYGSASNLFNNAEGQSNNLYNSLMGAYSTEAANPAGFGPTTKANMTTAAEQSEGGALGAATGKAQQYAAANRNSGSFTPTLDEASRQSSRRLGSDTLGIQNEDASLKEQQKQQGLSGESNLQSQQNSDVLASLGLENQATGQYMNSQNNGWLQNALAIIKTLQAGGVGGLGGGESA